MLRFLRILLAALLFVGYGNAAFAVNLPLLQGPLDPSNQLGNLNALIQELNSGITPNSTALNSNPRNYLDNGSFDVNQRNATGTCAQTAGTTETTYGSDRWACVVNVTSGAGQIASVTSTPTPYLGFANAETLVRNSGSLAQPVCMMQEIETARATQMQGQAVDLSIYGQALAGLSADNGNAANLYIFTGTGTNQGLGTFTASPAITPAWTNIATPGSQAITLTASWQRYQTGPVYIAPNVTEIAAAICFTPTTTSSGGSTDGLAVDGVQLEVLGSGAVTASPFEFLPLNAETAQAARFYQRYIEPASGVAIGMQGTMLTTTTCALNLVFATPMFKAPTFSHTGTFSTSTWQIVVAADTSTLASTWLVSPTAANSVTTGALVATLTTASTAGWACQLQGAGGTSSLIWGADF